MTTRADRPSTRRRPKLPTPEAYAEFVGQIELLDVWLVEAHVVNRHGPRIPRRTAVSITPSEPTWTRASDGFDVQVPYSVRFVDGNTTHAEVSATFGLHFTSDRPMSDAVFEVFRDVNLPVNAWPFLREFVSTTVGRMGWQPLTLPTHKHGVSKQDDADVAEEPVKSRRRAPRRSGANGS